MKGRLLKIEKLRILAMIAVIINHLNVNALHQFDYSDSLLLAYIANLIHVLARIAVPIFFIISGYLMLRKAYKLDLKKNIHIIIRYIVVIVIYGTAFSWIEIIFENREIKISQLFDAIYAMFTGNTWEHMWFLYAYVGIMLILPILKKFWENAEFQIKHFILWGGVFVTSVLVKFDCGIQYQISSVYVFYFLFGGLISDYEYNNKYFIQKVKTSLMITSFICVGVLALITYFIVYKGNSCREPFFAASRAAFSGQSRPN